jgi:anti-sigma factor ChrR (cupin superfamily)
MPTELVNADFSQRVVLATGELPWVPSPQIAVERRLLDRIGGEVARATSLVRYAPVSRFPSHSHELGEEFLVLEGVLSDEHGDYPKGTYVRNPPGSRHTPHTEPGCVIFVKLRQMHNMQTERVVIDTTKQGWQPGQAWGLSRMELFREPNGEVVALERLEPDCHLGIHEAAAGEEILILEGDLYDNAGMHQSGTWIRNPAGFQQEFRTRNGSIYWVKRGHLPREK